MNNLVQLIQFTKENYSTLINWIRSEKLNYLWGGSTYTFPLTYQQLEQHCCQDTVYPYLLTVSGQPVGYVELCRQSKTHFRICRVLIADDYQGQGYAKLMLTMLLDIANTQFMASSITLNVFQHNVIALKLYSSLGFEVVSKAPFNLPDSSELWQLVSMKKSLPG